MVFKSLTRYRSENKFVGLSKIYTESLSVDDNAAKNFNILATTV